MLKRSPLPAVRLTAIALCLFFAQITASVQAEDTRAQPERASGIQPKPLIRARHYMIVTANPHASQAGKRILAQGGSAIDAAIAAQMVLNLVEPQSSGIGGGAFILHWDETSQSLTSYDGRETAPLDAKPDLFAVLGGGYMKFRKASFGGLPVGTPGLLQVLELSHKKHGKRPWKELFAPAIELAKTGFPVSARLHSLLKAAGPKSFGPEARSYFYTTDGRPWPIGHKLKNLKLARTLEIIANKGADAFYDGEIPQAIVAKVRSNIGQNGVLSLRDFQNYQAKERPPICAPYRGYKICGMGPPSSGGLTIAQVLALIEPFDLGTQPLNVPALHIIAEAQKLAFADRARYMADSDFVDVPGGLLNPDYIAKRRQLIDPNKAMQKAKPGTPPMKKKASFGEDATNENKGTSHLSIIDKDGNGVSMTTTIESGFGANIQTHGFLLNNELTDFSFRAKDKAGRPVANRIEPGKRPRSSMSPTMVFNGAGKLVMIAGSPGGSRIIPYVIKTLVAHIDWGLNASEAAALANFGSRNGPFEIEPQAMSAQDEARLTALGHKIRKVPMTSGSHIIIRRKKGVEGGADPRREGRAQGD